jgi:3-dehydroquinate synthase
LGEQSKSLVTVERLYRELINRGVDRNTFLLGVGGGIVTDITGFVASTYMRGLEFGFVSTTLLGQVDAALGGKNGVNIGGYKNMVGTFSHPRFVICDVALLATLSDREFRAGLAEVVKSAIIGSEALFEVLESVEFKTLRTNSLLLSKIVEAAQSVKISVVSADQCEKGLRRVLNLGHTVAHAIEKCSPRYNHGEAVAIGLSIVARVAVEANLAEDVVVERVDNLLRRLGFDIALPVAPLQMLKAMRKDKKRDGETLHLILPEKIGQVQDCLLSFERVESMFATATKCEK